MEVEKVASALNSELRREILKVLAGEPETALGVLNKLKERGIKVRYRETVYRALEKLVEANLVEKFYKRGRGICYGLLVNHILLRIDEEKISIEGKKRIHSRSPVR
ncbi:MAG: hypothetical protein DRK00_08375 [Thermoprotei archaeon]|nr:MAG: hypothetical protein DRK00_08375 [Thermoprotei archaeon]